MQELISVISSSATDFGIGCLFWLVAAAGPFRKIHARIDWRWDIIGLITAVAFGYYAEKLLDIPVEWALNAAFINEWYEIVSQLHPAVTGLLFLILADLGVYWAHRLLHSHTLWNAHAWHHAPEVVYWAAGQRGSFQDTIVLFSPYAVAFMVFPVLDAATFAVVTVLNSVINAHLIHSNIRIPFTRQAERIFVTPRVHFVHHSANKRFGNSNYGKIFTVWDRMFGTYTNPDDVPADQPLGLGYEANQWKMMLGIKATAGTDETNAETMRAGG